MSLTNIKYEMWLVYLVISSLFCPYPDNMSIVQLFFNIDFTKNHDHILKNDSFQKEVSIHLDPSTGLITRKIEFIVPSENYLG